MAFENLDNNNDINPNGIPEQSDLDISLCNLQPDDSLPEVQLLAIPSNYQFISVNPHHYMILSSVKVNGAAGDLILYTFLWIACITIKTPQYVT